MNVASSCGLFDLTAATEKGIYKRRLRIVGDRFYIYEELNEQF